MSDFDRNGVVGKSNLMATATTPVYVPPQKSFNQLFTQAVTYNQYGKVAQIVASFSYDLQRLPNNASELAEGSPTRPPQRGGAY